MDIYLEDKKLKEKAKKAYQMRWHYVKRRDAEKDEVEKAKLQRKVDQWWAIQCSPKAGCFRVNYNSYSLSYWLAYNIDPKAKGEWGLEPFYSAIKDKKEPIIKSKAFGVNLLKTARRWYEKALKLKDKESFLMVVDLKKSSFKKNRFVSKKVILKPEETNDYIDQVKDLVTFAELAVKTKSPIYVSA